MFYLAYEINVACSTIRNAETHGGAWAASRQQNCYFACNDALPLAKIKSSLVGHFTVPDRQIFVTFFVHAIGQLCKV